MTSAFGGTEDDYENHTVKIPVKKYDTFKDDKPPKP